MDIVVAIFVDFQALRLQLMSLTMQEMLVAFGGLLKILVQELMTKSFLLNIFLFVVFFVLDCYYLDSVADYNVVKSVESCLMAYVAGYLILAVVVVVIVAFWNNKKRKGGMDKVNDRE